MRDKAELLELLQESVELGSELTHLEWKAGAGEGPICRAICALANLPRGLSGVLFVGIDARSGKPVEEIDISKTQQDVCSWASDRFNYTIHADVTVLRYSGRPVLAFEIPPCPVGKRPCHFKNKGPFSGAWMRVGNSTRKMTEEEARRVIMQDQVDAGYSPFDVMPLPRRYGPEIFSEDLVKKYVTEVKNRRPDSRIDRLEKHELYRRTRAIAPRDDGTLGVTPTGILFFCEEPHFYLAQASVAFTQFWGVSETEKGPDGSFFRDDREVGGPLPAIIDEMEELLFERIQQRGVLNGFKRQNRSEYPRFSLREVIVNAVAHRDYTIRSKIRVRLFPDRIEVRSPGGLLPPVTVDNIEYEQATRNPGIVQILKDSSGYMEERGIGVKEMIREMKEAGLSPPHFEDSGSSFVVVLKSHILMTKETLSWLRTRYRDAALNQHHRLALAFLRVNDRMYNRDYARLTGLSSIEATRDLQYLKNKEIIKMLSTRGGARYVLAEKTPALQPSLFPLSQAARDDETVLQDIGENSGAKRAEIARRTGMEVGKVGAILARLRKSRKVIMQGQKRGARYWLPPVGSAKPQARANKKK